MIHSRARLFSGSIIPGFDYSRARLLRARLLSNSVIVGLGDELLASIILGLGDSFSGSVILGLGHCRARSFHICQSSKSNTTIQRLLQLFNYSTSTFNYSIIHLFNFNFSTNPLFNYSTSTIQLFNYSTSNFQQFSHCTSTIIVE